MSITQQSNRVLRLPEVKKKTGLGRTTIYRKMGQEEFPKTMPLGDRAVGWLESEIDHWISERASCRRAS